MMRTSVKKFFAKTVIAALTAVSVFQLTLLPTNAADFTAKKDTLTRLKVSTTADHTILLTLPTGVDFDNSGGVDFLIYDFPATFSQSGTWVTGDFTFNDGTARTINAVAQGASTTDVSCTAGANNVGVAIDTDDHIFRVRPCDTTTFTASGTAATVTFTIDGTTTDGTLTNPGSGGSNVISLTMDDNGGAGAHSGTFAVAIVTDDQVSVTASVDPSITFNVGAEAAATACAGTYAGNGGTVALGTLTTGAVASSDASSVMHICTRVSTNAGSGAAVTVRSLNAALASTAVPADTIASATATLVAGTSGYGMCAGSAGADHGRDSTTPTGSDPVRVSPFNGASCTSAGHDVGVLTTGNTNVWTIAAASQNAFYRLYIKAAISATVPAHTDYADTLTFIATGTF